MKQRRFHAVIASVGLHLLFVIIAAFLFSGQREPNKDAFEGTLVTLNPARTDIEIRLTRRTVSTNTPLSREASTARIPTQVSQLSQLSRSNTEIVRQTPPLDIEADMLNPVDVAVVPTLPSSETLNTSSVHPSVTLSEKVPVIEKGASSAVRRSGTDGAKTGLSEFLEGSLPTSGLGDGFDTAFRNLVKIPRKRNWVVFLKGTENEIRGHIRLIRLKHSLSDWWQDPTAIPALIKWLEEHTSIRADMDFAGGALSLTDPQIMDAPLIIMTGHDKDITVGRGLAKDGPLQTGFTSEERAAFRKYIIEKGGMLFFDDCGFNGLFAHIVADELNQIFPEYPLEILPHDHEVYSIYYNLPKPPNGGDVFWGNENNAPANAVPFSERDHYRRSIGSGLQS